MLLLAIACSSPPPAPLPGRILTSRTFAEGTLHGAEGLRVSDCPECPELVLRPSTRPGPDVLILSIDTLRADHARRIPALVELAETGLDVQAWAPSPWTFPSVVALLAGRPITQPIGPSQSVMPFDHGLAQVLREAGWGTHAFVNNPHLRPSRGLTRGFDRWLHLESDVDVIAQAEAQLRRPGGDLVFAHVLGPHIPYVDGFDDLSGARAGQYDPETLREAYARSVDERLGGLGPLLQAADVVVVVGDHGEELFEHGGFEHGHAMWEELLRVPMLLKAPGLEPGAAQGTHVDIGPTLVALLGLEAPREWTGRDLRSAPVPIVAEHLLYPGAVARAVIEPPFKLLGDTLVRIDDEQTPVDDLATSSRLAAVQSSSDLLDGLHTSSQSPSDILALSGQARGEVRVTLRAEGRFSFAPDAHPTVCGDVRSTGHGQRVEIVLDVAPELCRVEMGIEGGSPIHVGVREGGVDVELGPMPVDPAAPGLVEIAQRRGPLEVQLSRGAGWGTDARLRALGYVE